MTGIALGSLLIGWVALSLPGSGQLVLPFWCSSGAYSFNLHSIGVSMPPLARLRLITASIVASTTCTLHGTRLTHRCPPLYFSSSPKLFGSFLAVVWSTSISLQGTCPSTPAFSLFLLDTSMFRTSPRSCPTLRSTQFTSRQGTMKLITRLLNLAHSPMPLVLRAITRGFKLSYILSSFSLATRDLPSTTT